MKVQRKTVVSDAVQFDGATIEEIVEVFGIEHPEKVLELNTRDRHLTITTARGPMTVAKDDWILRTGDGDLYLCNPVLFDATYEPVHDVEPDAAAAGEEKPATETKPTEPTPTKRRGW